MREATLTPITEGRCGWAMSDKDGMQYPHDTKAHYHIDGAGEIYDGDFCARHAAEAALDALNEERREREAW